MNQLASNTTGWCYQHGLKPVFFAMDAENVHHLNVTLGGLLGQWPPTQHLVEWAWQYSSKKLTRTIDGMRFSNPVGLSAGFDYNGQLTGILPSVGFGWHTIGTVTWKPYQGNTKPRLGRLPRSRSLIVNKGLKNDGAERIIQRLAGKKFRIPTGISIASTNQSYDSEKDQITDMVECFKLFEQSKVKHAYYELNISCPNTFGGEPFTTPTKLATLLKAVDKLKLRRPLYLKMPIDQPVDMTLQLLKVANIHDVQGLIIGNLTKDKANPAVHKDDLAIWKSRSGNLSGKPTWERSNQHIAAARKKYPSRFTIVGTGGIFSGEDAQIKLDLGADLVQLITGMIFQGPQLIGQINHYLDHH